MGIRRFSAYQTRPFQLDSSPDFRTRTENHLNAVKTEKASSKLGRVYASLIV